MTPATCDVCGLDLGFESGLLAGYLCPPHAAESRAQDARDRARIVDIDFYKFAEYRRPEAKGYYGYGAND